MTTTPTPGQFPHLPADVGRALADYDARLAAGDIPMDSDGFPAPTPPDAGAWLTPVREARERSLRTAPPYFPGTSTAGPNAYDVQAGARMPWDLDYRPRHAMDVARTHASDPVPWVRAEEVPEVGQFAFPPRHAGHVSNLAMSFHGESWVLRGARACWHGVRFVLCAVWHSWEVRGLIMSGAELPADAYRKIYGHAPGMPANAREVDAHYRRIQALGHGDGPGTVPPLGS